MIDKQTQEDLLVTALEGGSNYWYMLGNLSEIEGIAEGEPTAIRIFIAVEQGAVIPVFDMDSGELLGHITKETMHNAAAEMLANCPTHYADIINEGWDAETADVWFQYVVMNELVFG
jgi:hypothetical protein